MMKNDKCLRILKLNFFFHFVEFWYKTLTLIPIIIIN